MVIKPNYLTSLRINFSPCDKIDRFGYEVEDQCIADEKEQKKYLDLNKLYGYISTFLFFNYETFESDKYDDEAIQKVSMISRLYFDAVDTKWIDFDFQTYILHDDTISFKYGAE